MTNIITGPQCRMARALLRWTEPQLAEAANIGRSTVRRIEVSEGIPSVHVSKIKAVHDALLATGKVEFIGTTGVNLVSKE